MLGVRRRICSRGLILWFFIANILLVLYYITNSAHLSIRTSPEATCPLSLAKSQQNETGFSQSQAPGEDRCSPKINIMFVKTHKTASSTVLNVLFRFGEKHRLRFALPDGRNDFFYPSPFQSSWVKDYRPGKCFNIVCNHMRFDHREVAKLLPPDAVYITILRDPVALFESSFHYYHSAVPFTWRIKGKNKLAQFLEHPERFYYPRAINSFYLKNLQFFDFGLENNLEADDPQVMKAIQNLSQHLDLVLITEYFEESLILLKDMMCWTVEDILYFKLNMRRSSSVSQLTPDLKAKALQWNGADWKLYQHFNATFWARVEAFGRGRMKEEVEELRRRNTEMKAICIEDGGAVESKNIQDKRFQPWQPFGDSPILGYNLRKTIDPKFKAICEKMLMPELQYLSDLGVNLWVTGLLGWIKDNIFRHTMFLTSI
ncbi:galactosylceramide sulfotransferase [Takifugu rubripes]|uniref:galactosylceramide sulfotransferase n=1 Tax=Takifugu rubripes TaxID=31033 RepID=UPI000299054E|nr:galactosylceramide sulfotransferase-like [Takifugu rubripes]|eukprot:XP_003965592.1 PREDICTED: galactosylceramide sulfotransferase-like [Takifugu rubripes]